MREDRGRQHRGKTVLYIATSLDDFVAGKNNDLSWLDPYNSVEYGYDEFFATIEKALFGCHCEEHERRSNLEVLD